MGGGSEGKLQVLVERASAVSRAWWPAAARRVVATGRGAQRRRSLIMRGKWSGAVVEWTQDDDKRRGQGNGKRKGHSEQNERGQGDRKPGRPQGIAPTIYDEAHAPFLRRMVGAIPCGRPGLLRVLVFLALLAGSVVVGVVMFHLWYLLVLVFAFLIVLVMKPMLMAVQLLHAIVLGRSKAGEHSLVRTLETVDITEMNAEYVLDSVLRGDESDVPPSWGEERTTEYRERVTSMSARAK